MRKKRTDKQLVKALRVNGCSYGDCESDRHQAADVIERMQDQIKSLQRHRLVPIDMQPRRGTVEPDHKDVFYLDFETLVLDSTDKRRVTLIFEPDGFGLMVQALLMALDFPEGDIEYVRERLEKVIYDAA
jgi:hypothetical protein